MERFEDLIKAKRLASTLKPLDLVRIGVRDTAPKTDYKKLARAIQTKIMTGIALLKKSQNKIIC